MGHVRYDHVSERVAHVGYKYQGSRRGVEFEVTCATSVCDHDQLLVRGVEMCVCRGECVRDEISAH